MSEPVLSGEIGSKGVLDLLLEIEARRTSGVIRFENGAKKGEVTLVAGQPAEEQKPLPDGSDPLETLLALRAGKYEVFQKLPPLQVSQGDDVSRTGSLAVHVPADLMNWCERAGLTGTLSFEREGRRAEAMYDKGELVEIRVDGDDAALNEVFGWEEGTFAIKAERQAPNVDVILVNAEEIDIDLSDVTKTPLPAPGEAGKPPPLRRRKFRTLDETGPQFLQVVEVALSSIVEEREKRRSPSRSSPPMGELPIVRRQESARPPEEKKPTRPPTVRIVYLEGTGKSLAGSAVTAPSTTKHVRTDITGEMVLPEARPHRKSGKMPAVTEADQQAAKAELAAKAVSAKPAEAAAATKEPDAGEGWGPTIAWAVVSAVALGGAIVLYVKLLALE